MSNMTDFPSSSDDLDFWNYFLYSLELLLNLCFMVAYPVISYICLKQKILHINFRVLLQLANTGYLLGDIQRSILVVQRLCCIGNVNTPFVLSLTYVLVFGAFLFSGAWFALVIERVYASWRSADYEKRCKSCLWTIFVAVIGVLPAVVITLLKVIDIGFMLDLILMFFEFGIDIFTAIALVYILYYNKRIYKARHNNDIALSGRYQLTENIRATRYIIPVAICDFFGRVVLAGLLIYSVFFTDIPLGQDTSHLSHAYDLNSAVRRLFFGCWLIFKNEGFFLAAGKDVVVNLRDTRDKHFEELQKQWE